MPFDYRDVTVCVTYDVPYVGGYSNDGKVIYLDRDLPERMRTTTGKVFDPRTYLIIHESVEAMLIHRLGIAFNEAHTIALGAEMAALQKDGVPIDEYYAFIYRHVEKKLKAEAVVSPPYDLDLKPYIEDGLMDIVLAIRRNQ
jgi:hypothetical protein